MGFLKKIKPQRKTFSVNDLKIQELEYFCTTKHLDKAIAKQKKVKFDDQLADAMEEDVRFYFVVKVNLNYCVISGVEFEKWLKVHSITSLPKSDKARTCIHHYINSI